MPQTIFTLGPAGTNSHEAATRALHMHPISKSHANIVFCGSNTEVLETVFQEGQSFNKTEHIGVVPVENSTTGLVQEVTEFRLGLEGDQKVHVIGEILLPIQHHLLVHPSIERVDELTGVISHPQALAQCDKNLKKLSLANRVPTRSTAEAARLIAENPEHRTIAALASDFAGKTYKLKVLVPEIQDRPGNATIFHVHAPYGLGTGEHNRTAVLLHVKDKLGILHKITGCIASHRVNMATVHSIPMGNFGEIAFYIVFDCHQDHPRGGAILKDLRKLVTKLVVLGSYAKKVTPEETRAQFERAVERVTGLAIETIRRTPSAELRRIFQERKFTK